MSSSTGRADSRSTFSRHFDNTVQFSAETGLFCAGSAAVVTVCSQTYEHASVAGPALGAIAAAAVMY